MSEPSPSEHEDFQRELEILRSIIRSNLQRINENPLLDKQLDFWMESAQFVMSNLKIWEDAGNQYKYEQSVERMQKVLGILQDLIDQLNQGPEDYPAK